MFHARLRRKFQDQVLEQNNVHVHKEVMDGPVVEENWSRKLLASFKRLKKRKEKGRERKREKESRNMSRKVEMKINLPLFSLLSTSSPFSTFSLRTFCLSELSISELLSSLRTLSLSLSEYSHTSFLVRIYSIRSSES